LVFAKFFASGLSGKDGVKMNQKGSGEERFEPSCWLVLKGGIGEGDTVDAEWPFYGRFGLKELLFSLLRRGGSF
jgi:hypothetical protein